MQEYGIWKTIKVGFWLGIGFIIPQMIVMYGGTIMTFIAMPSMMQGVMEDGMEENISENMEDFTSELNRTAQVELLAHEDRSRDGQLLILGSLKNGGEKPVSSIQLEAELFDENNKFVYECTEYISRRLMSGDVENYQIKCGCKGGELPQYSTFTVRVVGAQGF
jgi:hypothetical protein